jgi:cytochrome P450
MFFAGHDTTASTIAATFCMLAYHPSEQAIVYEEIQSIAKSNGGQLAFENYEALSKTRSAFVEALRMFPSGHVLIRESTEDTVLSVPTLREDGSMYEKNTPIPKGTVLVGDMVGMREFPFLKYKLRQ